MMEATLYTIFRDYVTFSNILAVLGITAAVVIYFRQKRYSTIMNTIRDLQVVGGAGDGLGGDITITYKGVEVPRVTKSIVVIWNAGNKTIRRSDIATHDPLRIDVLPSTRVLQYRITRWASANCAFSISALDENYLHIDFEYIEPGEGVRIELLHDGLHPDPIRKDEADIVVRGKLIDGLDKPKIGVRSSIISNIKHSDKKAKKVALCLVALGLPFYFGYLVGVGITVLYRLGNWAYNWAFSLPLPSLDMSFHEDGYIIFPTIFASYVVSLVVAWRSFRRAQPSAKTWERLQDGS